MKTGRSLSSLAAELERRAQSRRDFVADTSALHATVAHASVARAGVSAATGARMVIEGLPGQAAYGLTPYAHDQLAAGLKIPREYYRRMQTEAPQLLATNVDTWLHTNPARRLFRTLDGDVRAYLSDKYRPLDDHDLAEVALPILVDRGCQVVSAELTETRMYIKAVLPALTRDIRGSKRGDVVQAGIVIRNSEVGNGAVSVEPFAFILACLNGATFNDSRLRKYHVGKRAEQEQAVFEMLTTETRRADDKAFFLKVRDVIRGAFNEETFARLVAGMEAATQDVITKPNVEAVITDVTAKFTLPEYAGQGILKHLIAGGDLSRWGLSNAVTGASQDVESYELATTMERAGGEIIELQPTEWRALAMAA